MFCSQCGSQQRDESAFCSQCGASLKPAIQPDSEPTARPVTEPVSHAQKKAAQATGNTPKRKPLKVVLLVLLCILLAAAVILAVPVFLGLADPIDIGKGSGKISSDRGAAAKEDGALSRNNAYYDLYREDQYLLPDSNSRYLSYADVAEFSDRELFLAQQELYARHGQAFSDRDVQQYFSAQPWYTESTEPAELNAYEAANVLLLQVCIDQLDGAFYRSDNPYANVFADPEQYAIADSASRYLNADDLRQLDKAQLVIARNEIYARHGFLFTDPDLLEYFYAKHWYVPTTVNTEFTDDLLTEIEQNNIKLILIYERRLDGITFSNSNPYRDDYDPSKPYLLPGSDTSRIQDSQLTLFDEDKCILARNEIFARHGYTFSNEDILEYFLMQPWYYPSSPIGDSQSISMSALERENVEILLAREKTFDAIPDLNSLDTSLSLTVQAGKFSVQVPAYWNSCAIITTDTDSIRFEEKLSNTQGVGGFLFSISLQSDNSFEHMPSYNVLGQLRDSGGNIWQVVAFYPSDVQFLPATSALYNTMRDEQARIFASFAATSGYTYTAN